jgi:Outer membrane protein beta-barrel family/Carboxypeptidase regulatory-like domain
MRKVYLLLILLGSTLPVLAQKNGSIKGIAFDTLSREPVASATVSVMDKKDSSLISFTMTDNGGRFELKGIPSGDYRLLITHVNYHSSNTFFSIDDNNKSKDFGNITMNDVTKVLAEVVVSNEAPPVTLIGDTVQYNAGSFKTVPNANVEQLLKKLPGVKVDKDGTVTAQGEKVNRVLVDGKEFFGNDPKIATRNLPADAVDKVQVYDKQSDQAQLTGFEDGNYEKTINLKLKKDKKKAVFGKLMAGAGNRERYEGKFNVNSFKGARQISAIGMGNNTNAEGFSFMDILNFTGALNQMRQGGNININFSGEDAAAMGLNTNRNGGINTAWGGGLNYNNIIGDKLDFQSNYFYNRFNPNIKSHLLRQNIFQGSSNFYDENAYTDNRNNTHRFNLNMLYQIDSMTSLRIVPSFSYQQTRNRSQKDYSTTSSTGELINKGFGNNVSGNKGYNFRNDLVFRKKFNRKGRTFSLSLGTSLNESDGDGDLQSIINYYSGGSISKRDTLNQQNDNTGDLRGYTARAVYTEPLWKKTLLEFSAGKSNTKSTSAKTTWDYNKENGKYDKINDMLTNDFENTYGYTNVGFRMRKQGRKYNYSLGLTWQHAQLDGKIISGIKDSLISKDFKNILPNGSFKYNFSRFKSFSLNYGSSTNQPTISQLQPVPDNTNPLYIREGNPDLKQEYNHTLRASLNLLSPYKNKNLFMFFTLQTTRNKIVNYDSVNLATGVRRTRPVNVNGVYNANASINYSLPVRALKATLEIGNTIGYNKTRQFINQAENTIKTVSLGPDIRLDMNPNDKLSLGLGASYMINTANYSLESSQDNHYLSQEYEASVEWQLPRNFFFATEFTYTINSQRAAGFNTNVPIWNASFSKQFLKYSRGEIKLTSTDLLNRNTGISRTANQNYIEDKEVNTLRRFFLLSFTYSLSKSGLNKAGPGGMRMMMR